MLTELKINDLKVWGERVNHPRIFNQDFEKISKIFKKFKNRERK